MAAGGDVRCSWGWTPECSLGILAPRSVAHAGGEGRAGIKGAEDALARKDCGGAEAQQRRRRLKSERLTGGARARVRWGFCCGLGWPEGDYR
jgi:hypothetical protein